jgi:hypothetical protein
VLLNAKEFLKVDRQLDNIEFYLGLTDSIIEIIGMQQNLTKSNEILNRIYRRQFYRLLKYGLGEFEDKEISLLEKKKVAQAEVIVNKINLNLSKGDKNPIEYVSFFDSNNKETKFNVKAKDVTGLVPEYCNETISRIYLKNEKD